MEKDHNSLANSHDEIASRKKELKQIHWRDETTRNTTGEKTTSTRFFSIQPNVNLMSLYTHIVQLPIATLRHQTTTNEQAIFKRTTFKFI